MSIELSKVIYEENHELRTVIPKSSVKPSWELAVRDLMTPDPITLTDQDTLREARDLFAWKGIRHLPITDEQGAFIGLFTHRDFLTVAISKLAHVTAKEENDLYAGIRLHEVMGRKITSIAPEAPLGEAARLMFENKYGCLPVVDSSNGRLVGIITEADFVRAFVEFEARYAGN